MLYPYIEWAHEIPACESIPIRRFQSQLKHHSSPIRTTFPHFLQRGRGFFGRFLIGFFHMVLIWHLRTGKVRLILSVSNQGAY